MSPKEIEEKIIECLKVNIADSNEPVPSLTRKTSPLSDISGFDSLRVIEVIIELEDFLQCELPPEKVFASSQPQSIDICAMAISIKKLMEE